MGQDSLSDVYGEYGGDAQSSLSLLHPVLRAQARKNYGLDHQHSIPFTGADIWNAYGFSWLNQSGKPQIALLRWVVPCQSQATFEHVFLRAYLDRFAMQCFVSSDVVLEQLTHDLTQAAGVHVCVTLVPAARFHEEKFVSTFDGVSLDRLYIQCNDYTTDESTKWLCVTEDRPHQEVVYSDLLCSRLPESERYLWGSIRISYTGLPIVHEGLLRYLVGYRQEDVDEQACVERIYLDIQRYCHPQRLQVYARYCRRDGVDVNVIRSSAPEMLPVLERLVRQ